MGDRYSWVEPCPFCGAKMGCYYAESCDATDVQCPYCKKEFDIVMGFKLVEKSDKKEKSGK